MSKEKKDISQKKHRKDMLRIYTKGSAINILQLLKDVDTGDIITSLYLFSEDRELEDMLQQYERQLLLAKTDESKFKAELHTFFYEQSKKIRKNKSYYTFFKLMNYIYTELHKNKIRYEVTIAYQNILLQQHCYLLQEDKLIIGIKNNGELITRKEIIKGSKELSLWLAGNDESISFDRVSKFLAKSGFKVRNGEDIDRVIVFENNVSNQIIDMSYFINENTSFLTCENFQDPSVLCDFPKNSYKNFDIDDIKGKLINKKYSLPKWGVDVKLTSAENLANVIFYEVYKDNKLFLLYKVYFNITEPMGAMYGFYNLEDKIFYSYWQGTSHESLMHNPLEKTILSLYATLTCSDAEVEEINFKNDNMAKIIDEIWELEEYINEKKYVEYNINKVRSFTFNEFRNFIKNKSVI